MNFKILMNIIKHFYIYIKKVKYKSIYYYDLQPVKINLCTNLDFLGKQYQFGWWRWAVTSLMLISASTYWSPFCRMEMRAAGGTRVPLMFDWLMWLSMPNVNAEWEKPAAQTHKQNTNERTVALFQPASKHVIWEEIKHSPHKPKYTEELFIFITKCKGWFIYLSYKDICKGYCGKESRVFTWLLQISVDQEVDFITGNAHLSSTQRMSDTGAHDRPLQETWQHYIILWLIKWILKTIIKK